jgi:predicted phage terminase large subunit-like protein
MAEAAERVVIGPQAGPQLAFLATQADIAIYGGAAGGGKTWALLLEPLRHVGNGRFLAAIFRRTYPQVVMPGGMWDESQALYGPLGARANQASLEWHFSSGARVKFAHLQHEDDRTKYDGAQFALLGFDQLESFSEMMFFYLLSRNRSVCGVRPYVRATCNPLAESWLGAFLAWWIDPESGYPLEERSGQVRWLVRNGRELVWADDAATLRRQFPQIEPKSVTFIPARLQDNKILMERDPGYLANLMALDYVERERLLGGNWKVKAEAGKVFNRGWFEVVDAVPQGGVECRFWDMAATAKAVAKHDPDYTAGVRIRAVQGLWFVTDCYAEQLGPAQVEGALVNISRQDAAAVQGQARYLVRWEIEPGSAGKREAQRLVRLLAGLDAAGVPSQGDKLSRARALAAQALAGNVKVLRGAWNERWLNHLHGQPELPHDDIMDASAGAFNALTRPRMAEARSFQG